MNTGISPIRVVLLLLLALAGCATVGPFDGATLVKKYSVPEFEAALVAEKKSFLANLNKYLDGDRNAWSVVQFREFPTIPEWEALRRELKDGDEIWEFRHRDYLKYYDGPAEALRHAYCVVRRGAIIKTIVIPVESMEASF